MKNASRTQEKMEAELVHWEPSIQTEWLKMCDELKTDQDKDGEKMSLCRVLTNMCVCLVGKSVYQKCGEREKS